MKKFLKIMIVFAVLAGLFIGGVIFIKSNKKDNEKKELSIVATSFAPYDFSRAVAGEAASVKMLLKPGAETHNFEPTPQDIIDIKKADLFVYVGGESDEWVERILKDNGISEDKTLKLMDLVSLKVEEITSDMEAEEEEEEEEYDEHVWTSPKNAMKIVNGIAAKLGKVAKEKTDVFLKNAWDYNEKIQEIDNEFRDVVKDGKRKVLVFGDRFPFRYFVDDYKLEYVAAFPGCSDQTEASSATIAKLIQKVKDLEVPVVLKIELSSGNLAETIANEAGVRVLEFSAAHNISEEDFNNGVTYVDIMEKNVEVLREALK